MLSRDKLKSWLYLLTYAIVFSIAIAVFYLYRPYSFIDHRKTKIICNKNNVSYDIGPNLIFAFDQKLDPLTDKNVRKLCEYAIINDDQDTYKTPSKINYRLELEHQKEGSWGDALLLSLAVFFLGLFIVNALTSFWQPAESGGASRIRSFVIVSIISLIIFQILLKTPVKKIFCERQMASLINNFKKSAYGYGLQRIQQEEPRMRSVLKNIYQNCLQK